LLTVNHSIISTVLQWDMKDLKSRASKIEKDRHGLEKEQLDTLKSYGELSREQHERLRSKSSKQVAPNVVEEIWLITQELESRSIVSVVLSEASVASILDETQHTLALEYLALQLAIRDREQITKVLCRTQPDHLTEAVRDVVTAYEPVIRSVHDAVDLSETVTDFERFLRDMVFISRPHLKDDKSKSQNEVTVPTVGDYVQLLKKHQSSCHRFLHQCAKNGKEVTSWFHNWAQNAAAAFRPQSGPLGSSLDHVGSQTLASELDSIFIALPEAQREKNLRILNAHAEYLSKLHAASALRLASVVDSPVSESPILRSKPHQYLFQALSRSGSRSPTSPKSRSTSPSREFPKYPHVTPDLGPGAFLARWQALLDDTMITPATAEGPIRYGRNKDVQQSSKMDVDADGERRDNSGLSSTDSLGNNAEQMTMGQQGLRENEKMRRPDVQPLVDALLPAFRELLAKRACNW